jgi:hypothetical protein
MKGVDLEGESGFDLSAATADFPDDGRLEDHHLAVKLAENRNAFVVARIVAIAHP